MPLELSVATEADMESISRSQMAAFHPIDPVHSLIFPSPTPIPESTISSVTTRQLSTWRKNPTGIRWVKITDSAKPLDEQGRPFVIAAAKWIFFDEERDGEEERWPREGEVKVDWVQPNPPTPNAPKIKYEVAGADDAPYISYILETFYTNKRRYMTGACAVLDICFTHPTYQKRGAGKLLVEYGIAEADRRGVPAWVEASVFGKGLYEKFGFGVGEGVVSEYWGLGPLGVRVAREMGVEGWGEGEGERGYGEGWKEEWTEKGYQGASWWFMGREAKGKGKTVV
ncbi:hypothetical protein BKA64DRAFT_719271 [Cadophora sp. MPI-SDFR-AT-0126]|nr:hypothetical protein BKA64DRAFT_719271 [Leotiomycetes sp. MPI-SDFR-AT-0126]